jgi:hypothetical protein
MKLVHISEAIVAIIGIVSLAGGLWLYFVLNDSHLSVWFPIFWGAISLYNAYKLHRTLILNNGEISDFQVKCHFFMYSRGTLVCLTFLAIVLHNVTQSVGFACFTLFNVGIEILIRRIENKKGKK